MNCPRCETSVLAERERDGITVDVCASCRGLWLDRGELEKLIARATRDFDERSEPRHDTPPRGVRHDTPPRGVRYDDDHYRRSHKKKSFFESLGDIFD